MIDRAATESGGAQGGGKFLSVIVPAYNYAANLASNLAAALGQLDGESELIVIDDGSTDDTRSVVESLAAEYPCHLIYAWQANAGAASARNHGLRLARGAYVLLLDADDRMLPGTIDAVRAYLKAHPETDLLIGGHVTLRRDGKQKEDLPATPAKEAYARLADYLLRRRISLGHGSFVARKSLLLERPYPEHFRKREDIPVFCHLLANARIACIDHLMVRVYKHPDSLRHRHDKAQEDVGLFVEEVFRTLPPECQSLRKSYAAIRCLSLSRSALKLGDVETGRRFLSRAWHLDWRQVAKMPAMKKTLRAWFAGRKNKT